ncbi:hypothetical protein IQ06DRAFT_19706 [Phaeosphaeriaceae sp. SRC1lsM3a]|nr:hypothetical protein IQ06DRAFT_19706 [Stagonospora sp. SRC1lsM3a]
MRGQAEQSARRLRPRSHLLHEWIRQGSVVCMLAGSTCSPVNEDLSSDTGVLPTAPRCLYRHAANHNIPSWYLFLLGCPAMFIIIISRRM